MTRKLSNQDYIKIRKNIIKKLYSSQAFSKGHLLYERLTSSVPSHLTGFVKSVLEDLIKDGLVLYYGRTKHGDAYQLNIKIHKNQRFLGHRKSFGFSSELKEIEDIIF